MDEKVSVVMSVLKGEMTQTEVSRRMGLSQTTISKWLKQFTESGSEGLNRGDNPSPQQNRREAELQAQVDELTTALGEA